MMRPGLAVLIVSTCSFMALCATDGSGRLEGVVQDENEARISGAELVLVGAGTENKVAETRADQVGNFLLSGLPSGNYDLQISFPGFLRTRIRGIVLAQQESKSLPPITLEVAGMSCGGDDPASKRLLGGGTGPRASLKVKVTDEDGKPLKGATVYMHTDFLTDDEQSYQRLTASDGRCVFEDIQPGNYWISVRRKGYFDYRDPRCGVRRGFEYVYPPVRLEKCPRGDCDVGRRKPAVIPYE